jgi:hypothetical protein
MRSAFAKARHRLSSLSEVCYHLLHRTWGRATPQKFKQPVTVRLGALGDNEHPPVGLITRVADQSQFKRPGPRPPAETDPLNVSVHPRREPDVSRVGHDPVLVTSKVTVVPDLRVRPTVQT